MQNDYQFIIVMLGWLFIAVSCVGVIFCIDAFIFGITGWSFIGIIDKVMR